MGRTSDVARMTSSVSLPVMRRSDMPPRSMTVIMRDPASGRSTRHMNSWQYTCTTPTPDFHKHVNQQEDLDNFHLFLSEDRGMVPIQDTATETQTSYTKSDNTPRSHTLPHPDEWQEDALARFIFIDALTHRVARHILRG